jgi:hypothetical protein
VLYVSNFYIQRFLLLFLTKVTKVYFILYTVRKYEIYLPADSKHKDKLQIESEKSGTVGPHPMPLIFKRRTE